MERSSALAGGTTIHIFNDLVIGIEQSWQFLEKKIKLVFAGAGYLRVGVEQGLQVGRTGFRNAETEKKIFQGLAQHQQHLVKERIRQYQHVANQI